MARAMYHGCQTYTSTSFDFKAMSMQQKPAARGDYFSLKPVRGSSPTASLTADLDANFHIDKRCDPHSSLAGLGRPCSPYCASPQAPTPRRSLFTTDLFKPREDVGECAEAMPSLHIHNRG